MVLPYYYPYQRKGLRFSSIEMKHIALSVLVLTIAFTLAFSNPTRGIQLSRLPFVLGASFIAVVTGFLLHELAQKALAQKYGCWAEFRCDPRGLLFALITAFFGIVFAAPGAVYISGYITKEQNGKISVAGPLTNLLIAIAFLLALFLLVALGTAGFISGLFASISYHLAYINLFLAGFNMIPFPPFDGSKVIKWNAGVYAATLALIIGSFVALILFF